MIALPAGIASPFLGVWTVREMTTLHGQRCRAAARRADAPTCGLTSPEPGLGGPHAPVGRESVRVWPHVADVNADRRTSGPLEDEVPWSRTSDDVALARLLIRKMDEHLREHFTFNPCSTGRRFSGRRSRRRLARRLSPAHDRLSGNTLRKRGRAGTRDAIPIFNLRDESTGIPASAASVLGAFGDPVFEGRARHPN